MRRVKGWTTSTIVLGLVLGGMALAPAASAAPDAPAAEPYATGGAAARSGAAYSLTVVKAARKAVAKKRGVTLPVTSSKDAVVYAPAKGTRWFAGLDATQRRLARSSDPSGPYGDMTSTSTAVAKELRTQLSRRGFTKVRTVKETHTWIYRSRSYVCQVSGPALACVKRSSASRELARLAPFHKALPSTSRYPGMSLKAVRVGAGATKGYRTAEIVVGALEPYGAAGGYFYKAPGGRWKHVVTTQYLECSDFERTSGSRKAFAGLGCNRGAELSSVRR